MTVPLPPPGSPPPRKSFLIYRPGGLPVLRAAIEELLRSSWEEAFRQRACEIALAFEGSFKASGHEDLALQVHSLQRLLELGPGEVADLGSSLGDKLNEILTRLESSVESDPGMMTG